MKFTQLLSGALVALLTMSFTSCGKSGKSQDGQDSIPKYEFVTVKPIDTQVTFRYPALLKGVNDVDIYPQAEGRITGIFYENGMLVKKGQKLVSIESSQQQMQVNTAKANIKSAQAVVNTAKLKLDSQKKLFDKHIVSEFVYRTAQNEYSTALAELSQAESQLAIAEKNLSFCTVTSPISGIVTGRDYNVGSLVGPVMSSPLTRVSDQTTIRAQFSIPEVLFSEVIEMEGLVNTANGYKTQSGHINQDYLHFGLVMSSGKEYNHEGRFHSMSGMVDNQTGTATCYVDFPNPDALLHSGNSATVTFHMTAKGVFIVPQSACKKLQDKYLLYRVNDQGLAESVLVEVQATDDGKSYIVTNGKLKSGDQILKTGVARIQDGMRLK